MEPPRMQPPRAPPPRADITGAAPMPPRARRLAVAQPRSGPGQRPRRLAVGAPAPRLAAGEPAARRAARPAPAATTARRATRIESLELALGRHRADDRSRRRRRAVGPLQARRAQRLHPAPLHHAGPEDVRRDPQASTAPTASSSRPSTAISASSSGCWKRSSRDDRGQVVARTYLTSETGKVYTMLAHAAGRFGE